MSFKFILEPDQSASIVPLFAYFTECNAQNFSPMLSPIHEKDHYKWPEIVVVKGFRFHLLALIGQTKPIIPEEIHSLSLTGERALKPTNV